MSRSKPARGWGALALAAWGAACANNPKTQSSGPLIEALGATTLYASDPGKLADWYSSRFRVVFEPEGSGFIAKDDTALGPIWIVINKASAPGKPIDVFFFVRNLDRVLGQLSQVGTSPLRLDRDAEGRPTAIVLDPEDNRIELVQR